MFPAYAAAQGMGFDMNQASQYLRYLPPIIQSVTQSPEEPKNGDEVTVTAAVDRVHFGDADYETVDSVKLYYTFDGEKWEEVAMDQDGADKTLWTGRIPAASECAEVDYYISARDTAGNIAMELPDWASTPGWEPPAAGAAPAAQPHDFLLKLYDHVNGERPEGAPAEIPSYMDITSVRFGYDADNFYFRVEFVDPMQQGTISPVDANLYILAVINRSLNFLLDPKVAETIKGGMKDFNMDDPQFKEMAKSLWVWYYAPLVDIAPPLPGIGKIPGIGMVHIKPPDIKRPIFETKGFKHKIHGNFLDLTVNRGFIGPSEGDTMTFVAGNVKAVGADIMSVKPQLGDISYTTTVILGDHAYDTCAAK